MQLSLHYHSAVFDPAHIARIGGYLVRALEQMVADPDAPHDARTLLAGDELELVAQFSRQSREGCVVVDRAGNPAPVGTRGRVRAAAGGDRAEEERWGRWLPDGTLQLDAPGAPERPPPNAPAPPPHDAAGAPVEAMQRIAKVWSDVLKIPVDRIRPEDDFFEIGGNSLAALRVALLLEGTLALRDVMRCSRLQELAALARAAAARRGPAASTLVDLTPRSDHERVTLVCVPYAGGNAVHFGPFASAMARCSPDVRVLGVELPGHEPESSAAALRDFASTARAIAEEVRAAARGPIVLWGHCVGSALALEVARQLEEHAVPVEHLFLAAKLLHPADEIRQTLENAERVTFADIRELYAEWSGSDALAGHGERFEEFVARVFRHDSLEGNRYLLARREAAARPAAAAPCTLVVSDDDARPRATRSATATGGTWCARSICRSFTAAVTTSCARSRARWRTSSRGSS